MSGRRIVRFSLDLEESQRNFARMFAAKMDFPMSVLFRAMLYELETSPEFANRIVDLIFSVPEEEVDESEFEDHVAVDLPESLTGGDGNDVEDDVA